MQGIRCGHSRYLFLFKHELIKNKNIEDPFNHNLKICSYSYALKSLDLQILMQWLRCFVRGLFLGQVLISFIKLNVRSKWGSKRGSINQARWWMSYPCGNQRKVKGIHDLSRISNVQSCWLPRVATFSSNFWMFFSTLISFRLLDIDFNSSFELCPCFKNCLAIANEASCCFFHFNLSLKAKVLHALHWTGKVSLLT